MVCAVFDLMHLCVAGDAESTPRPSQSDLSPGGGFGGTWGAGASPCSQPAAPPPVHTETEQKLTPSHL